MKNLALIICALTLFASSSYGQAFNTVLLDNWKTTTSSFYNDVWGYTAPDGTEYVIAGTRTQVHFLRISRDSDPVVLPSLELVTSITPGWNSSWRDFKTYGDFAYGVTDGGNGTTEGLLIFDLSDIANDNITYTQDKSDFVTAHNIFIDEAKSKLYVAGSNSRNGGLIVYDLDGHESAPMLLSSVNLTYGYVHDVYVRNDTAYCSHGRGGFAIWNFANPSSPIDLGNIGSGRAYYNHSSWLTDDGKTIYYAEEVPFGRPVTILDISDLDNLDIVGTIKEPLLAPDETNNVPHNPFIKDGYLYVSYYQDGVQVWDVRDQSNITKVAYYDTEPLNTVYNGTTRNWGTYPFFSNGKIVATDTQNGVFLIQISDGVLPLEFIDFYISIHNKSNQLIWTTAGEYNVSHFEIEHSHDGSNFESIGQLNASNENGGINRYIFYDETPIKGMNYYRIKSVDFDGKTNITRIKSIRNINNFDINIFPNPSKGIFRISDIGEGHEVSFHAQIKDISGRVVVQRASPEWDSSDLLFDLKLSSGNYLIDLFQNDILVWSDRLVIID